MLVAEIIFWACFGVAAFTYLVYPVLVALWAALFPRPWQRGPYAGSFTIVMAAHNEGANLPRRLAELTEWIRGSEATGDIVLASDGSSDATVPSAREHEGITVLDLQPNQGKAAALSAACAVGKGDILVFADARQRWAPDAFERLLENFADPRVGAVSGDLMLEAEPGVLAGVGLYWRFEKWLRKKESLAGSQAGVTGAIAAVRRPLFQPIPAGTLLDDVYWPLRVCMQGYRVVHDDRAQAFDRLPDKPRAEFRRKVRTLAGNLQLLTRLPAALLPWKNPVWFPWIAHKLLRLAVPWALLGILAANLFLLESPLYYWLLIAQAAGYGLAFLGLLPAVARVVKPLGAAASLLVLNAAAFCAFWVWISGRAAKSWVKIRYDNPTSV